MTIRAVLLDAGGVILDESEHEAVRAEIMAEVLAAVVAGYSVEAYYADVEEAVRAFCPSVYQYVLWKHVKPDRGLYEGLWAKHVDEWKRRRPPIVLHAGVDKEIRAIARDLDLAIAGQYGREVLALLEEHSLLDSFAHQVTQDDFQITKPDPRYHEQIAQAIGVEPKWCIMVGDRIDKDIIPAKQVGMRTIRVRVGLHRNQEPRIPFEVPDAELDGVSGLAAVVQHVGGEGKA